MSNDAVNVISGTPENGTWNTFHVSASGQWLTVATVASNGTAADIINIKLSDAPVIIQMMRDAAARTASEQLTRAQALADLF